MKTNILRSVLCGVCLGLGLGATGMASASKLKPVPMDQSSRVQQEKELFRTMQAQADFVTAMDGILATTQTYKAKVEQIETLFKGTFDGWFDTYAVFMVTGVVARIMQLNPNFTAAQILNEALTNWY